MLHILITTTEGKHPSLVKHTKKERENIIMTNDNLMLQPSKVNASKLQEMLDLHRLWLGNSTKGMRFIVDSSTIPFEDCGVFDISNTNLRLVDLRFAILTGAIISNSNLSYANLSGANLSYTDLSGANLRKARLKDADLSDADLRGADLRGADLSGANLIGADLRGVNLIGTDLSGATLSSTTIFYSN